MKGPPGATGPTPPSPGRGSSRRAFSELPPSSEPKAAREPSSPTNPDDKPVSTSSGKPFYTPPPQRGPTPTPPPPATRPTNPASIPPPPMPSSGLGRSTPLPPSPAGFSRGVTPPPPSTTPRSWAPSTQKRNTSHPSSQGSQAPRAISTIPPPPTSPPPPSFAHSTSRPPAPPRAQTLLSARPTVDPGLVTPAARVLDELVALETNERLLIVHDRQNEDVARAFEQVAQERRARVERIDVEALAPRPWGRCPQEVLAAVPGADVTLFAATYEEGEYDARHSFVMAATANRARHVHIVGTSRRAFVNSMLASSTRVFDLIAALRNAMKPHSKLQVRSQAGTSLEVEMAPNLRWFANGSMIRSGQWLNVPYGALVTSPGQVTGTYVVDASMGGGYGSRLGSLSSRPIRLTFEGGRVQRVECRDATVKAYVEKFINEAMGHDRVGLLSLGANIGIAAPLGELIHDENMPGLHLSLGENFASRTGALWTSHGQLAFAAADTDVDLDGEPLIRHGRYVRMV
ncbi:aminopeptidase [Polyangium jinanense]|nr:aminopeptidase [Polyangium jinanense]